MSNGYSESMRKTNWDAAILETDLVLERRLRGRARWDTHISDSKISQKASKVPRWFSLVCSLRFEVELETKECYDMNVVQ